MQLIKEFVKKKGSLLFQHQESNACISIFDRRGFKFPTETQIIYNLIKHQPHLYVAWTNNKNGYYYVGKSFQNGGRWKRQHAYHLGTIAHHLLNTISIYDQNHAHWIEHWMNSKTMKIVDEDFFSIELKEQVYISFIPFANYSIKDFNSLEKKEIRQINSNAEKKLILSYRKDRIILLNVQHN